MDWMDDKLAEDEKVIFLTRPHVSLFIRSGAVFISSTVYWWLIFPAMFLFLFDLMIFHTHQFVVTNRRFIQKRGLYYIRIKDWALHKIDSVLCTRSLRDRIQGSGSVILIGFTFPKSYFRGIANPRQLRDAIHSQLPAE